ncbi:vomeronasal type-1 receptor 90-like [Sciurus carolinensis]|uniref:vomeronasal type-1 receptor 90-like n=1 Tax=Sciurus carolinensis TaxID=30640 RepID=UPI001FB49CE3|nr:vomeronasal type-1 receptor 90-like [Sciurus carolinensis]
MTKSSTLYNFIAIRNVFFSQIFIGITANVFLLLFHILKYLLQHRPKPTDLTITHLALIHLLMLLIRTFQDIDIFGVHDIWNNITCKAVVYLYRLMRGLSLSTTCMLSVLQAITLSPRSSFLTKFKLTSPQQSLYCFLILWVFDMFINVRILFSMGGPTNATSGFPFASEFCSISPTGYYFKTLFSLMGIIRDIFLIGLMALSSVYMVTILCRHKRQCQHLHSTSLSPRASPELRATRTILLLMGFFMVMYLVDCCISSSSEKMLKKDPARLGVQMLMGNGYATISALMLISTEKRIITFVQSTLGKMQKCLCSVGYILILSTNIVYF